jgi:hypothetical protein
MFGKVAGNGNCVRRCLAVLLGITECQDAALRQILLRVYRELEKSGHRLNWGKYLLTI